MPQMCVCSLLSQEQNNLRAQKSEKPLDKFQFDMSINLNSFPETFRST